MSKTVDPGRPLSEKLVTPTVEAKVNGLSQEFPDRLRLQPVEDALPASTPVVLQVLVEHPDNVQTVTSMPFIPAPVVELAVKEVVLKLVPAEDETLTVAA